MLALILLFALPWHHVESGIVHLPQTGVATVGFKKFFKNHPPVCSADKHVRFNYVSREWAELQGKPGERVAWRCQ